MIIIQTRQKYSIKAIFVAFTVALRQQGCHLKTTNLIFTPSIFNASQFIVADSVLIMAQSTSILSYTEYFNKE